MALTLNQEVEILRNFCLKHKQINSFCFGDESETLSSITPNYPMLEAILEGSAYDKGKITRRYNIIVSDLVNKDESNETHVLSDIEQVCFDLINYLKQVANTGLLGNFNVSENITLTDFTQRSNDEHAGFFFELSITSYIDNSACNLPISEGTILDNNYIYVGGATEAPIVGNFKVEIKDQDGNILQTFNTSGEYMVTVLTGIQQVIGNTNTTVIQNIIN